MKRFLLALAIMVLLAGCVAKAVAVEQAIESGQRFVWVHGGIYKSGVNVLLDIATGSCWIWVKGDRKGGLAEAPKEVCEVTE